MSTLVWAWGARDSIFSLFIWSSKHPPVSSPPSSSTLKWTCSQVGCIVWSGSMRGRQHTWLWILFYWMHFPILQLPRYGCAFNFGQLHRTERSALHIKCIRHPMDGHRGYVMNVKWNQRMPHWFTSFGSDTMAQYECECGGDGGICIVYVHREWTGNCVQEYNQRLRVLSMYLIANGERNPTGYLCSRIIPKVFASVRNRVSGVGTLPEIGKNEESARVGGHQLTERSMNVQCLSIGMVGRLVIEWHNDFGTDNLQNLQQNKLVEHEIDLFLIYTFYRSVTARTFDESVHSTSAALAEFQRQRIQSRISTPSMAERFHFISGNDIGSPNRGNPTRLPATKRWIIEYPRCAVRVNLL